MNEETEKKFHSSLIYKIGKLQMEKINARFTEEDEKREIEKIKKEAEKEMEELKKERNAVIREASSLLEKAKMEEIKKKLQK